MNSRKDIDLLLVTCDLAVWLPWNGFPVWLRKTRSEQLHEASRVFTIWGGEIESFVY